MYAEGRESIALRSVASTHSRQSNAFATTQSGRTSGEIEEVAREHEAVPESSTTFNESSLPPIDGGWRAWVFLASAFAVEAVTWGFPDAYGTYLEVYLKDPRYTADDRASFLLPLVGVLTRGIMSCASVFLLPLAARYPHWRKWSVWIAVPICWASLFGASYAQTTTQLVALQGVVYSIGGALLYAPAISLMQEWFLEKRGLAQGAISCGTAFGGLILPLVLPTVIEAAGVSRTLRYQSIILTALLIPLLPFFKGRIPISGNRAVNTRSARGEEEYQRRNLWALVKNVGFLSFIVANILHAIAYFLPLVWIPTFGAELGLSANEASLALALLNAASIVGRMTLGYLADKYDPPLPATAGLVLTSISTFVLWGMFSYNLNGLIAFGCLYGCFAGGYTSLWTAYIRQYINQEDTQVASLLFGGLAMIRGVGGVLSTPIAAALNSKLNNPTSGNSSMPGYMPPDSGYHVADGKYEQMIVYVGVCFAAAAGVSLLGWGNDVAVKLKARNAQTSRP